jgi:Cu2+-exporting ATPase/Cu+-exporting ATPase
MVHQHSVKTAKTLRIDGMSCKNCVRHVTRALSQVPGLEVRQVAISSAQVGYDPAQVSEAQIGAALSDAGYQLRATE